MNNTIFKKLGIATIVAVYVLILVGGVVRASGSGMGCPDWPKCFGTWIPPTSLDQLPSNYQEIFGEKLKGEVEFNVYKTWTEYINRLLGVLIGFLIFLTFASSIYYFWKKDRIVVYITFAAFILVGFQGWLGSVVVATELLPWMVTTHLLVAVVIVLSLIWAIVRAQRESFESISSSPELNFSIFLLFGLSLGQFILGTRVREEIDKFNLSGQLRNTWIDQLGGSFYIHIIVALFVVALHWFFYKKSVAKIGKQLNSFFTLLVIMVLTSFVTGVILGVFDMSAYAQPLHLTFATIILGLQFSIYLINNKGNLLGEVNG
ncbi:cytochrome c oxidase assembly protein subunit 15 [Spirosomataceae bacterium TFI 002]|nr:cytochrome c oxidase assembly protein subunit 15 [Spirosomataceae bacterium TFI 002]